MNEQMEVLKLVARGLEKVSVSYMITGSIAASYYGVPRMTRDIDVIVALKDVDISRLIAVFKNDFYIDREMVVSAVTDKGMFNIIHNECVVKVDFIIRKDSEYRLLEFQRRYEIEIENVKMWIVSPEDLILSKLYWARESLSELQLQDVRNVLAVCIDIDMDYIEHWSSSLGLQDLYKRVR